MRKLRGNDNSIQKYLQWHQRGSDNTLQNVYDMCQDNNEDKSGR
jgi:hypothetical protein